MTEKTRPRFRVPPLPTREQMPILLSCLLRFGCAFLFSAASIQGQALPAALCLLTVPGPGLHGFSVFLGSCIGAALLWPMPTAASMIAAAILIRSAVWIFRDSLTEIHPTFLPILAALSYALSGGILMAADSMGGNAPEWYVLRILLCFCGSWLLRHMMEKPTRESVLLLLFLLLVSACGIAPFGLSAAIPLGVWLTLSSAQTEEGLTMAAVCGIALDLGRSGTAPMTAVFCLAVLLSALLPVQGKHGGFAAAAVPMAAGMLFLGTPAEAISAAFGLAAAAVLKKRIVPLPDAAEKRPARPVRQMLQASRLLQELGDRLQEELPPLPETLFLRENLAGARKAAVRLSSINLMIAYVKKAETSADLVVKVINPTEAAADGTLTVNSDIVAACRTDAEENRDGELLPVYGNKTLLHLQPEEQLFLRFVRPE